MSTVPSTAKRQVSFCHFFFGLIIISYMIARGPDVGAGASASSYFSGHGKDDMRVKTSAIVLSNSLKKCKA
jgi:hypothetical protein